MYAPSFKQAPDRPSPEKQRPGWSRGIRRTHRWLAIAFTAPVIANFIAYAFGEPPPWLVFSPLPPLLLLMLSGLYMFAQPYLERRRGGGTGT